MTGHHSTRLIGTTEARELRNADDYDDWEVGLEPIPGDTHWVRVSHLDPALPPHDLRVRYQRHHQFHPLSQPGYPRDSQVETHGSHPVEAAGPEFFRMNYDEYYRASRNYSWNDYAPATLTAEASASTTVPEVFKHRFSDPAEYDAWVAEERKRYFA
jgi:hypothetical protein